MPTVRGTLVLLGGTVALLSGCAGPRLDEAADAVAVQIETALRKHRRLVTGLRSDAPDYFYEEPNVRAYVANLLGTAKQFGSFVKKLQDGGAKVVDRPPPPPSPNGFVPDPSEITLPSAVRPT